MIDGINQLPASRKTTGSAWSPWSQDLESAEEGEAVDDAALGESAAPGTWTQNHPPQLGASLKMSYPLVNVNNKLLNMAQWK